MTPSSNSAVLYVERHNIMGANFWKKKEKLYIWMSTQQIVKNYSIFGSFGFGFMHVIKKKHFCSMLIIDKMMYENDN